MVTSFLNPEKTSSEKFISDVDWLIYFFVQGWS